MRVMVMVKATEDSEAGVMPTDRAARGRWASSTRSWSRPASCSPATACSRARRARACASTARARTVIDGPFAETKELVAGFWLWQVQVDLDEAIEWVKRCPNPMFGPSEIEIRPVFEAEDFGEAFTPELREQEERLRARPAAAEAGPSAGLR